MLNLAILENRPAEGRRNVDLAFVRLFDFPQCTRRRAGWLESSARKPVVSCHTHSLRLDDDPVGFVCLEQR